MSQEAIREAIELIQQAKVELLTVDPEGEQETACSLIQPTQR